MKRVLLSAFEPFAGESINPSLEAARQVAKVDFPDTLVRMVELPVDRLRAVELIQEEVRTRRPDVIVMLGEHGGRSRISPERVAINVDDFRIPDNVGNQPFGEPIVEGGPVGYFSTLPIRAIVERLKSAAIPAEISDSAGTFLCNRVFYSVMHMVATEGLACRAGFMHLPYLHEQVIEKRGVIASLSRETVVEGVRLAIETTVAVTEETLQSV
jgi:pyroglutamyl-peptidase